MCMGICKDQFMVAIILSPLIFLQKGFYVLIYVLSNMHG
uniref:Uncharacterized protein n=1 Tax=Rhizophora mucronata TaxID=61149 RepID=A0A2P2Q565_RHIMU